MAFELDLSVWGCRFEGGVVALLKSEKVFVGHQNKIAEFFEFLKKQRVWLCCVVSW